MGWARVGAQPLPTRPERLLLAHEDELQRLPDVHGDAEQTTLHTSYEAGSALGPDAAVQASLFRGLGLLVGYSHFSRA